MENTGKVLFTDETPQWYIALGTAWIGPLSASDVYQKILNQEVTWAHFVWKSGQSEWKRLCDVKAFQAAVPAVPGKQVQQEIKEVSKASIRKAPAAKAPPAPRAQTAKTWFLHYDDAQYGPFSDDEIRHFLKAGKIHGRVFAWRDGMGDWARLESVEAFKADMPAPKKAAASAAPKDQRGAPRRPLVAKIMLAHRDTMAVAVCRDISVGGMQVLTDQVPGEAGDRIKLNVSPAKAASGKAEKIIEPFVAEGVIVRVLEDGRGFSFRFDRLPEASRRAIEKYIQAES